LTNETIILYANVVNDAAGRDRHAARTRRGHAVAPSKEPIVHVRTEPQPAA